MKLYDLQKINGYEYTNNVIREVVEYIDDTFLNYNGYVTKEEKVMEHKHANYEIDILNKAIEIIKMHKLEEEE